MSDVVSRGERVPRYYEQIGRSSDELMRCADCRRLVPAARLRSLGSCSCGCRRVKEITTLSLWEWLRIRLGILRFPYRREFLQEFDGHE